MKRKKKKIARNIFFILLLLTLIIFCRYIYKVKSYVDEVSKWTDSVNEIAKKYDIEEYSEIALAIILTETKGDHIDLMQSSESKYGETNRISDSQESLETGIEHLAETIKASNKAGTDVWTAVQAYNFGLNYIEYVKNHGGENTVPLAEEYSRKVLAPTLGNETGETYRYLTPKSIRYNGGHLYQNGGNFFYAEIVEWNMKVMTNLSPLPRIK